MKRDIALLVFSYGTPREKKDILPYYTSIRHGFAPTAGEVQALEARYDAIGGLSPLAAITRRQAEQVAMQINERNRDIRFHLFVGNKHMDPSIEDAVSAAGDAGFRDAVAVITAPYFSLFMTQSYFDRADRRASRYKDFHILPVPAWNKEKRFSQYWADALMHTRRTLPADSHVKVVFTAHSLPYHVLDMGDTYPTAVTETADRIAALAGITDYEMAWQSAGVHGDWLEPDVDAVTTAIPQDAYDALVYVPIGFVSDHLEILYDLDIRCRALCNEQGFMYRRVPMPNDDPFFIEAMTEAVDNAVHKEAYHD